MLAITKMTNICAKFDTYDLTSSLQKSWGKYYYLHLAGRGTEAQKGRGMCPIKQLLHDGAQIQTQLWLQSP